MPERNRPRITELRFRILNSMMDDAEDVEQVYLSVNKAWRAGAQPGFPLRDVIDELRSLHEHGLIKAEFTRDETRAPLKKLNQVLLHYYWFSPTEKGEQEWKRRSTSRC